MNKDKTTAEMLVTPKEALKLADFRTTRDFEIVESISEYYKNNNTKTDDFHWNYMRLLSAIWNAGRVQGIREERLKHKSVRGGFNE